MIRPGEIAIGFTVVAAFWPCPDPIGHEGFHGRSIVGRGRSGSGQWRGAFCARLGGAEGGGDMLLRIYFRTSIRTVPRGSHRLLYHGDC